MIEPLPAEDVDRKIIVLYNQSPRLSFRQIAKELDMTDAELSRHVQQLARSGEIVRRPSPIKKGSV